MAASLSTTCSTTTAWMRRSPSRVLDLTRKMIRRMSSHVSCVLQEKNWSVVRRLIGYDRFETEDEYLLLQSIYADLRLYTNYFQPVLKLVAKDHVDKKLIKRYDQ